MIQLLAHIRNLLVILVLSWLGFSQAPNEKVAEGTSEQPTQSSMALLR